MTYKLYLNNPSITTKFLRFSEISIHYDMFRPARPFFGDTQYYPLYKNQMSIFIGLYIVNIPPKYFVHITYYLKMARSADKSRS